MKVLKIIYEEIEDNGDGETCSIEQMTLFDAEITEISWSKGSGSVRVEGKLPGSGGGAVEGIISAITKMSKDKTAERVEQYRTMPTS